MASGGVFFRRHRIRHAMACSPAAGSKYSKCSSCASGTGSASANSRSRNASTPSRAICSPRLNNSSSVALEISHTHAGMVGIAVVELFSVLGRALSDDWDGTRRFGRDADLTYGT